MLLEIDLKIIANRLNILKKFHYLLLRKVSAPHLQYYWFRKELIIKLQLKINLPITFVMIYPINFKIGQIYLRILQICIIIIAYIFFLKLLKESRKILEQSGFFISNYTWQLDNSFFWKNLDYKLICKVLLKIKKVATFNIKQQECFERVILAVNSIKEETRPYFFI